MFLASVSNVWNTEHHKIENTEKKRLRKIKINFPNYAKKLSLCFIFLQMYNPRDLINYRTFSSLCSLIINPLPPLANCESTVSHGLSFLDISYKWNHTIYGLLHLTSFHFTKCLRLTHDITWI